MKTHSRPAPDVRLSGPLPLCGCRHGAAGHYPLNAYDSEQGVRPCWTCGCRDYAPAAKLAPAEALLSFLIESYGAGSPQRLADWERDAQTIMDLLS